MWISDLGPAIVDVLLAIPPIVGLVLLCSVCGRLARLLLDRWLDR